MPLVYKIRENDIVNSRLELEQSIINNLSLFFEAFQQKLIYEIKLVPSITTQDGTTQRGTSQRAVVGKLASGKPKYKTIVNKFAVMDIYINLPGQTRKKLTRLALAPVDILDYNPSNQDLETQSNSVAILINAGVVEGIPTAENPAEIAKEVDDGEDTGYRFYEFEVNGEKYYEILPWLGNIPFGYTPISQTTFLQRRNEQIEKDPARWKPFFEQQYKNNPKALSGGKSGFIIKDGIPYKVEDAPVSGTTPAVSGKVATTQKSGANATTLSEWYQAQGQTLPSVAQRAITYESLGLGNAKTYIGTGEQNVALLAKLKAK